MGNDICVSVIKYAKKICSELKKPVIRQRVSYRASLLPGREENKGRRTLVSATWKNDIDLLHAGAALLLALMLIKRLIKMMF
ncbi:MAG: hypothetical protein ACI4QZ_02240 [Eubacteriales bacterium]